MEQLNFFEKLEKTKPICMDCGNSFEKNGKNKICSKDCRDKRKKDYYKKWYEENKDSCIEYSKNWRIENKDRYLNNNKKWYRSTIDNRREYLKNHLNKKYKEDPEYKLKKLFRKRINDFVFKRTNSSSELLGCDIKKAREHLEKQFKEGMTWENHGNDGWHIDHILPCASFDLTDPEQQKKCFHYTNLQPLWAKENMSKGAKIL